jgi:imidazolonepropionase
MKAYIHASEILTGAGIRKKSGRKISEEDLGRVEDGAVVFDKKKIVWVGPTKELPKKYNKVSKKNLKNKQAIVPAFVDCHTHLVFAGNRASEFADRCAGVSYQEIAARGGGILTTVNATRNATQKELIELAVPRLKEALSYGVKTIEIKSGYGLSVESEIKVLEVIQKLKKMFKEMTIVSTFLGAHAFPKELTREEYMDDLIHKMLPEIAKRKLADFCDVFVDEGYYTLDEARKILEAAKKLGLKLKVHADELKHTEATGLAVEMGAFSADHLLKVSDFAIRQLATAETVAVLLPGTAFYLKAGYAPARQLLEAGACVALSTDFNPGTCMTLSLPLIMMLAALYMGMTRAEIFAGVTFNAAKSLGLQERKGTIEVGMDPDLLVLPFERFEEVYYRVGRTAS